MVKCVNCLESLNSCICSAVDAFFSSNKHLQNPQDTKDNKMTYNLSKCLKAAFYAAALASGLAGCIQGRPGDPGAAGPRGLAGSPGLPGVSGPQGPVGPQGEAAQPCTTTLDIGGIRVTCPDGSYQIVHNGGNGETGPVGPQGIPGPKGDTGGNGADGENLTPIVPVQVCPGIGPTVYPSSFPEFAFCIAGSLYATYWSGSQAFTALIPPGQYASTSPQGCNFTVYANCVVVQN